MLTPPAFAVPALPVDDGASSFAPRVARWRWWVHLVVIGGFPFIAKGLSHLLMPHKPVGPALGETVGGLLRYAGLTLAVAGGFFFLGWLASRASVDDLRLRWRHRWWSTWLLGVGYSFALRIGTAGVLLLTCWLLVWSGWMKNWAQLRSMTPDFKALVSLTALAHDPLYLVLCATLVSFVMAGLVEEFWRAATLAALEKLFPRVANRLLGKYLLVSVLAVVFALGHLYQGWVGTLAAGIMGVGLGAIMVFHRSIWPAVIAHGFVNAGSFVLMPLAAEWLKKAGPLLPK